MAKTKQAKKMVRKIERKTDYNRMWKGKIKLAVRNLDELLASSAKGKNVDESYSKLQKAVDKAVKAKVIPKNKGDKIKSRAAIKVSKLSKPQEKPAKTNEITKTKKVDNK